jgi:hypothetical protein
MSAVVWPVLCRNARYAAAAGNSRRRSLARRRVHLRGRVGDPEPRCVVDVPPGLDEKVEDLRVE